MLFMKTNRTRSGLGTAQWNALAAAAKQFYASIPADVTIRGEWAAADRSHNYTLLYAPDIEAVRRIQAPFEAFTGTVIVPVASNFRLDGCLSNCAAALFATMAQTRTRTARSRSV